MGVNGLEWSPTSGCLWCVPTKRTWYSGGGLSFPLLGSDFAEAGEDIELPVVAVEEAVFGGNKLGEEETLALITGIPLSWVS